MTSGHVLGGSPDNRSLTVSLKSKFIFILEVIYAYKYAFRIQVIFNYCLIIHSLNGKYQASESLKGQRTFGEIISLCTNCTAFPHHHPPNILATIEFPGLNLDRPKRGNIINNAPYKTQVTWTITL